MDDHRKSPQSRRQCLLAAWVGIFLFIGQTSWGPLSCRKAEAAEWEANYDGTYIALSLGVLSKKAAEALSPRSFLPKELATLCGIMRFAGFVADEGNSDVLLVGQEGGVGSPLHIDDLVVTMRSIWRGGTEPVSCSLDPRREDVSAIQRASAEAGKIQTPEAGRRMIQQVRGIWGSQVTRVGGVPKDSRYAHFMIDADYHMKKVSLGVQKVSGINSYLDMKVSDAKQRIEKDDDMLPSGLSFNRFWFSVKREFPVFTEDEGIVWIKACPIDLFTEQQMGAYSGELLDIEEDDPVAMAYAEAFSDAFPRVSEQVPPYADLKNLYLLKAVLESMRFRRAAENVGLNLEVFLSQYAPKTGKPMPDSMQGCVVKHEAFFKGKDGSTPYWYFPVIFGGVNMEMELRESNFEKDKRIKRVKSKVLETRPSPHALYWRFTVP